MSVNKKKVYLVITRIVSMMLLAMIFVVVMCFLHDWKGHEALLYSLLASFMGVWVVDPLVEELFK